MGREVKHALSILSIFVSLTASAQVSYWWQQMNRKPDARQSQEFFFVPGSGVNFTYATNHVIINSTGGGGGSGITTNICVVFCDGSTNTLFFTNGVLFAVNATPTHCSSLIQPGGGYLIQPGGGTLCLP